MIVYPPIFYGAELKLAFRGKLTWKVADTLHNNLRNKIIGFTFSTSHIIMSGQVRWARFSD